MINNTSYKLYFLQIDKYIGNVNKKQSRYIDILLFATPN